MKKKLRFIILTVLCLCLIGGVTGCAVLDDTINEINEAGSIVGVDLMNIDGCLYYDTKTNIVYIWNGIFGCSTAGTTPSPYYASNGLPYKYDPDTKQLKEITNGN